MFGGTNTNTGTTGSIFGQQPAQTQQPAQQAPTSGLFGNTGGGSIFGAKPAGQSSGLFGATQPPAQPAQLGSSLFGNNQSGSLFGSSSNALGQQQQQPQQKPSMFGSGGLFGSANQQTQPVSQPPGGLFGSMGQQQPSTSMFGAPPQQNSQPALGGTLFGNTMGQSTVTPQTTLTASIDQNPYGRNELFNYTGQKLELGNSIKKPALPPLTSSNFRVTPTKSQLNKLRGFSSPLTSSQSPGRPASPLLLSTPGRSAMVTSPGSTDRYRGLTDTALTPNAFVPRPSIKKLTVHPRSSTLNGDDPLESILGKSALQTPNGTPQVSSSRAPATPGSVLFNSANGASSSRRGESSLNMSGSEPPPKEGDYWSRPRLEKLRLLGTGQLKNLHNFTVGRKGFGEVTYAEPVDLTGIDLNNIYGTLVMFKQNEIAVYPDEVENKPTVGKGLNQPATVTLESCWPKDKATKQAITDMSDHRVTRFIKRIKSIPNVEFVSFTDDGTWTFRVEHFSRYGINDEDESDSDQSSPDKTMNTAQESASANESSDSESDESDEGEFLPPTRGLRDDESSEEGPSQTEASSVEESEHEPTTTYNDTVQRRLGDEGIRKIKEMQAAGLFYEARKDTLIDKQAEGIPIVRAKRLLDQDFERAGGDSVADDRAIKRASFGILPAKADELRVPRKYARVKLNEGSSARYLGVAVDSGLGLGRSFRASWGPNGELVHMGKVCGPNAKK